LSESTTRSGSSTADGGSALAATKGRSVRVVFAIYLTLIIAGIAFYVVIGLTSSS
jgi:hypothetical protein